MLAVTVINVIFLFQKKKKKPILESEKIGLAARE